MRNLSKLVLLAMTAFAAMAFAASTASALHPVNLEVRDENTPLVHCPAVELVETDVNGGCLIHATSNMGVENGEVELRKHVFGVESHVTTCENEFHGRVDESARGYIFEQQLKQIPGHRPCNRKPCTHLNTEGNEPDPWAAEGYESAGQKFMHVKFCVSALTNHTREECEVNVPFRDIAGSHEKEFGTLAGNPPMPVEIASTGVAGFRCEVAGHWRTETGGSHDGQLEQDVLIAHL